MIRKTPDFKGYGWSHLVLTIENSPDIKTGLEKLTASFRRLRQQKWWKLKVAGGAFVLEIKNGSSGYHVHLHAIIYSKFLSKNLLNKKWEKSSGAIVTWISRVHKGQLIFYLTKYLTKPVDLIDDSGEVGKELARYRMFQPFGIWHGIKVEKIKRGFPCPSCNAQNWIPDFELHTAEKYHDPADRIVCEVNKKMDNRIPIAF